VRTDDLIDELVANLPPVGRFDVERRVIWAAGAGLVLGLAALATWLGMRPDLQHAIFTVSFWMKLGFTVLVAVAALALSCQLARPARDPSLLQIAAASPFVIVVATGLTELAFAAPAARLGLWLGGSWDLCPIRILALSMPAFAANLWAFRGFAPTRLRIAGFAAGLLAGGIGASVYAFACIETTPAFLATWYSLGILAVAVVGAVVGPRALAW
jgi:hypothetical protein